MSEIKAEVDVICAECGKDLDADMDRHYKLAVTFCSHCGDGRYEKGFEEGKAEGISGAQE
jgi:hydrogenase maturation factor HypF (carbamoyltransferase family)